MNPRTVVLVVAVPGDASLALLEDVPPTVEVIIGYRAEDFAEAAPRADVILHCSAARSLLQEVFRGAPRVRWVHSRAAGVDTLLFPELVESGVSLTNGRGVFSLSLAEFVLGAVFFFAKDYRRMVRAQTRGAWEPFDTTLVRGQTLGIVGYGDIGRTTAALAVSVGMRVMALRRNATPEEPVHQMFGPDGLHALLAASDAVVLSTPLTPETRGLIGAAELAVMKPGAILINVARGPVVSEAPLLEALQAERIRGAALDVFDEEPLPAGHPFYGLGNVLLSAHSADHTVGWLDDAMRAFLANLERFVAGQPLHSLVDPRRGY